MNNYVLKIFSVVTSLFMLLVLMLGSVVTKTESGEGCGDSWPFCNGEIIPSNPSIETIIEYSHRITSSTVGLLIIIFAIWSWRTLPQRKEARFFASSSLFFVILQGLLGAAAVKWSQSSAVLALHFGFSLVTFASVLLLTILVFERYPNKNAITDPTMRLHLFGLIIYTYIVVYTGALVRHTHASLSCLDWPLCGNDMYFWESPYSLIQMGHRFAAGMLFVWVLVITVKAWKKRNEHKVVSNGLLIAFGFIMAQVISGALVVLTLLNLSIALLHVLFISCFFGVISYLSLLAIRGRQR